MTVFDLAQSGDSKAITSAERRQRVCGSPDFDYIGRSDLRIGYPFAVLVSPLHNLVRGVVGVRAKEQVVRVDAGAIVAAMTDKQSVWNLAVMALVREAVRILETVTNAQYRVAGSCVTAPANMAAGQGFWNGVVVQPLRNGPMIRHLELFTVRVSHYFAPYQRRMVRARGGGANAARARLFSTTKIQRSTAHAYERHSR